MLLTVKDSSDNRPPLNNSAVVVYSAITVPFSNLRFNDVTEICLVIVRSFNAVEGFSDIYK